jgi:hypothetical protein
MRIDADTVIRSLNGKLGALKNKHLDRWLSGYATHVAAALKDQVTSPQFEGTRHLLFALCDHYEPLWGDASEVTGTARVDEWAVNYPKLASQFVDADGKHPQHSFFFPGEEYRPAFFDRIDAMVRQGAGEVELHLHHDGATEQSLRAELQEYLGLFSQRGHFTRGPDGRVRYAFIHGNWALANGRPDGQLCGVDNELEVLWDTGCYADFTFPSIPDVTQPNIVNQIYWPVGDLSQRRCYEHGERSCVGKAYDDRLLLIQGPTALGVRDHSWKPRLEYAALQSSDPPSQSRVDRWVRQNIHVQGRPEWVFVKTHTHGAPEKEAAMLLHEGGLAMHRALQSRYNDGVKWRLHYVTAREMYNITKAAMAGKGGDPNQYRDFELPPPPIKQASRD